MKKLLVTGAAGFIGSNFVDRAREHGCSVVGVDDMSNGFDEFSTLGKSLVKRSFDHGDILKRVRSGEFNIIVHFAANPRVTYSVEHPVETNDVNVTKTLKLIDACVGNVERFVFASSSSVYGHSVNSNEEDQPSPMSPYALQKLTIEHYLKMYSKFKGLDSCSFRIFNAFGPRQLGSSPYSCAIAAWLTSAMNRGSFRLDGDGMQTRDLCYVDDIVDAFMMAVVHSGKLHGETFNVGSGVEHRMKDLLEYVSSKFGDVPVVNAPERPGDPKRTLADVSKLSRCLKVRPVVNVYDGIDRTFKWYVDNWSWLRDLKNRL